MKQIREKITSIFKKSDNCVFFIIIMISIVFISIYKEDIKSRFNFLNNLSLNSNRISENYQETGATPPEEVAAAKQTSDKIEDDIKNLQALKDDNDYLLKLSEMDEERQMKAKLNEYEALFNKEDQLGEGNITPIPDRLDEAIPSMIAISKNNFANTLLDYSVKEANINQYDAIKNEMDRKFNINFSNLSNLVKAIHSYFDYELKNLEEDFNTKKKFTDLDAFQPETKINLLSSNLVPYKTKYGSKNILTKQLLQTDLDGKINNLKKYMANQAFKKAYTDTDTNINKISNIKKAHNTNFYNDLAEQSTKEKADNKYVELVMKGKTIKSTFAELNTAISNLNNAASWQATNSWSAKLKDNKEKLEVLKANKRINEATDTSNQVKIKTEMDKNQNLIAEQTYKDKAIKEYDTQINDPTGIQSKMEDVKKIKENIKSINTLITSIANIPDNNTNWKPTPSNVNYQSRKEVLQKSYANSKLDLATKDSNFSDAKMNALKDAIQDQYNQTHQTGNYLADAKKKYVDLCKEKAKITSSVADINKAIAYLNSIKSLSWFPDNKPINIDNEIKALNTTKANKGLKQSMDGLSNANEKTIFTDATIRNKYTELKKMVLDVFNVKHSSKDFMDRAKNRYVQLLVQNRSITTSNLLEVRAKLNEINSWNMPKTTKLKYELQNEINKINTLIANRELNSATVSKKSSDIRASVEKQFNREHADKAYQGIPKGKFMDKAKREFISNITDRHSPITNLKTKQKQIIELNDDIKNLSGINIEPSKSIWSPLPSNYNDQISDLNKLKANSKLEIAYSGKDENIMKIETENQHNKKHGDKKYQDKVKTKYINLNYNGLSKASPLNNLNQSLTDLEYVKNNNAKWEPLPANTKLDNKIDKLQEFIADSKIETAVKTSKANKNPLLISKAFDDNVQHASDQVVNTARKEYINLVDKPVNQIVDRTKKARPEEENNLSHYELPALPINCKNKNKCEFRIDRNINFGNASLNGCANGYTQNYTCKGSNECPYQIPGNWRWKQIKDKNNNVVRCIPPKNGTKGHQNNTKYGPKYYLR